MADGGTIKTNVTQLVTFYNTESIIEKDKNIYFAPKIVKTTQPTLFTTVRQIWLDAFNAQVVGYNKYKDIPISTWSPEDRTLLVKGNVDDFRTDGYEGFALNYFILTRVVKYSLTNSRTMYYGFFIVNAEQAGQNSVRLTVEPDYFTNVFYLSNLTPIFSGSESYSPFNDKMGNVFINRQHYNRVKIASVDTEEPKNYIRMIENALPNYVYTITFVVDNDVSSISNPSLSITGGVGITITDAPHLTNNHTIEFSFKAETITDILGALYINFIVTLTHTNDKVCKDNEELFLNTEESYKYRYQEKDYHMPVVNGVSFTRAETKYIEEATSWSQLQARVGLQEKIMKCCLTYFKVVAKENLVAPHWLDLSELHTGTTDYPASRLSANYSHTARKGLKDSLFTFYVPFINIPKQFEHLGIDAMTMRLEVPSNKIKITLPAESGTFSDTPITGLSYNYEYVYRNILDSFSKYGYGDYIESIQIVKDVLINDNYISYDTSNLRITLNASFDVNYGKLSISRSLMNYGFYNTQDVNEPIMIPIVARPLHLASSIQQSSDVPSQVCVKIDSTSVIRASFITNYADFNESTAVNGWQAYPVIMLSNQKPLENTVSLDDSKDVDLTETYYDNVLEQEPYSFWSISYLAGVETPLYKIRYYKTSEGGIDTQKYSIKMLYVDSGNDIGKIAYIPVYDNIPYYNEAISLVLTNQIPLQSDSYFSYFNQNSAQMKNQYAVNNYQRGSDLAQRFFNTAPAQVGASFVSGGQAGGYSQIIRQASGMIDDAIDWGQSNKIISMTQRAKMADMGAKPDILSNLGTDAYYELLLSENSLYLNHYHIDELSYNSIAKYLERFGYVVNIYDRINDYNRVGMNFVKTNSFDFHTQLTEEQETSIRRIFSEGVTLLHDKSYLTDGHNYETILDE